MTTEPTRAAHIASGSECIIDSGGRRVPFDDQRVVHVLTDITSGYAFRLAEAVYGKYGRRCRSIGPMDSGVMQYAKRVCSGRECIPLAGMAGAMVRDVSRHLGEDEIGVYFTLDQEGPCQNGAWPLVWETFTRRLGAENVIAGVNRNTTPGHLGLSDRHLRSINDCVLLGDLFEEAENALVCIASDPLEARGTFDDLFRRFAAHWTRSDDSIEACLAEWAEGIRHVPIRTTPEEMPKVLVIGGLNLMFVHFPVTDYFLAQGVLPKVVEVAEGACWVESENTVRYGFRRGHLTPGEQFSFKPSKEDREEAMQVRKSRLGVKMINTRQTRFRKAMAASGLLFDRHHSYVDIVQAGHPHVSSNGFTETTATAGRYLLALADGLYDGFVNLGAFNCQPAMNAQAVIRPLANRSDLPYVAIDCEGPWLSGTQLRLLEALSVRAKRIRSRRNGDG